MWFRVRFNPLPPPAAEDRKQQQQSAPAEVGDEAFTLAVTVDERQPLQTLKEEIAKRVGNPPLNTFRMFKPGVCHHVFRDTQTVSRERS